MKKSTNRLILCVAFLVVLTSIAVFAQTTTKPSAAGSDSDQLLKDILNEVRQMRTEMQRANVYSHRSQVLLDRIKVEDQIARYTRDIADARDQVEIVRKQLPAKQIEFDEATKRKDAGLIGPGDFGVVNGQLQELQQREQNLLNREAQISADLGTSRKSLSDLNKRLDDLDREIGQPTTDPGKKKP